jgi:hypothetical protein
VLDQTSSIVPVGVFDQTSSIVPVGVLDQTSSIVPVGVLDQTCSIIPVGVLDETSSIVPVGVLDQTSSIVPVGVLDQTSSIVPVGCIQSVNLKRYATTITYCSKNKNKSKADPLRCNTLPASPCGTRFKITLVARTLLTSVAQWLCWCEHGVLTSRTCVPSSALFAPKSLAAVRGAFRCVYRDEEVTIKTTVHRVCVSVTVPQQTDD